MSTINKEIKISGKGLMSAKDCDVNLFPSQEKGIRFFVPNGQGAVEATLENVASTQNFVVLANDNGQVQLCEHFLAACAFCGIDSLDVCLSSQELPILDGSSKEWVEEFKKTGVTSTEKKIKLENPIKYEKGNCSITIEPADKIDITYQINFDHPDLKEAVIQTDLSNQQEIIEARTFGYVKDLEKFQKMGIALGANINNTVGLTDDGYSVELRSELEPVKHKVLDLAGDFKLAGIDLPNLKAKITAKYAGHASHIEVAKILKKELDL